jgi:hypothetical protein
VVVAVELLVLLPKTVEGAIIVSKVVIVREEGVKAEELGMWVWVWEVEEGRNCLESVEGINYIRATVREKSRSTMSSERDDATRHRNHFRRGRPLAFFFLVAPLHHSTTFDNAIAGEFQVITEPYITK